MINEQNDANLFGERPVIDGLNPEKPQFKQFGTGVPQTDVKTLIWIVVGSVIMISIFRRALGL